MKTIAIFGGTFDPIHNGHLQSALELKQQLKLDQMRLLPCHRPPHRDVPGCTGSQRLEMVRLAITGTDLIVDDREMLRPGLSYSVDTLEQYRREFGDETSLCWVMGTDAFAHFDRWHRWQEFLSLAHIIVISRPDAQLPSDGPIAELVSQHQFTEESDLHVRPNGSILFVTLQPYPISATGIRAAIASEEEVEQFLPAAVLNYIHLHQLYQ
ncbi:MAG: nicotinate-nucleotide adenylyltransferase [Oceanicoccus sp.]